MIKNFPLTILYNNKHSFRYTDANMKKIIILWGMVIIAVIGGFLLYSKFFSGSSFTSVNIQLGAIDEKAAAELCQEKSGHARLVCLTDELKKTVSGDLLADLQREYSVADAQKWSNFPPVGYRNRIGPTLDRFNPSQLAIVKAILKEAAGTAADEGSPRHFNGRIGETSEEQIVTAMLRPVPKGHAR